MDKTRESFGTHGISADIGVAASLSDLSGFYASADAFVAAAGATKTQRLTFGGSSPDAPRRVSLTLAAVGSLSDTKTEDLYMLRPAGDGGVLAQRALTAAYTLGAALDAATAAALGVTTSHRQASAVALSNTGLLNTLTRKEARVYSANGATVEIYDVGEATTLVRVFNGTGVRPLAARWL